MKSMMPEASFLMQHLLRDGAWFARIVGALVADDDNEDVVELEIPPTDNLDEALTRTAIRLRVIDAALRLAEPYRTAVLLRFLEGETIDQITAITRTPKETVRAHVRHGVAQLKEVLKLR
jgi:DNA-directed RNA polymerase specialized sigma24 family protein